MEAVKVNREHFALNLRRASNASRLSMTMMANASQVRWML